MIRNKKSNWSKENVLLFKERWKAVTIPVNIKIDKRQTALHLDQILSIIRVAETIGVENCFCRTELQNCDLPRKICLNLNMTAIKNANEDIAEIFSKPEAEKIILEAHQKELVHLALHHPEEDEMNIQTICSCCSCCCSAFQGLIRMNMTGLGKNSPYFSTHDPEKCNNCKKCTSMCYFKARTLNEGGDTIFNETKCYGCGLYVTTCPEDAIVMNKRVSS